MAQNRLYTKPASARERFSFQFGKFFDFDTFKDKYNEELGGVLATLEECREHDGSNNDHYMDRGEWVPAFNRNVSQGMCVWGGT